MRPRSKDEEVGFLSVSIEEKPIKWVAWYRTYGHNLRSEWFGVAFPTDVGEFQVKFDSDRGRRQFKADCGTLAGCCAKTAIKPFRW